MAEYIKREAAEQILENVGAPAYAIHALVLVKTADVAPVAHGRWLDTGYYGHWKAPVYICSNCRKEVQDNYIEYHKYCLHCGAKMDGE